MTRILGSIAESTGTQFFSSLLPAFGGLSKIKSYAPSFFARLEKVQALKKDLNPDSDRELYRRTVLVEQMLLQALDWLHQQEGAEL